MAEKREFGTGSYEQCLDLSEEIPIEILPKPKPAKANTMTGNTFFVVAGICDNKEINKDTAFSWGIL